MFERLLLAQEGLSSRIPSDREARFVLLQAPVAHNSWLALPLFSNQIYEGVGPDDFHASYRPHLGIGYFDLPKAPARIIAEAGISRLGQLLLAPRWELLRLRGFGGDALRTLWSIVVEFYSRSLGLCRSSDLDWSSPEAFVESVMQPLIPCGRQRRVLLQTIGADTPRRSLRELAEEHGVTRERIRQIAVQAQKRLLNWRSHRHLAPLRDFICRLLAGGTGHLSFAEICRAIQDQHGWNMPLDEKILKALLPALRAEECVEKYGDLAAWAQSVERMDPPSST